MQCYPSNNDRSVALSFGRTAPIPSANASEPHSRKGHQHQEAVQVVTIPDFGPYYCLGSKSGVEVKVSAFFSRVDGKIDLNISY